MPERGARCALVIKRSFFHAEDTKNKRRMPTIME
jgi:hypothetical protein